MNRRAFITAAAAAPILAALPALPLATEGAAEAWAAWAGLDVAGGGVATLELIADTSILQAQLRELSALGLEAGDVPESVLHLLRDLVENLADELTFSSAVSAVGTVKHVVVLRLREGGRIDAVTAALRARRDEFLRHGNLRSTGDGLGTAILEREAFRVPGVA